MHCAGSLKESVMRILSCLGLAALAGMAGLCSAEGLKPERIGGYWSTAQTRLQINAVVLDTALPLPAWQLAGSPPLAASLGGDYFFSKRLDDAVGPRTGLRASGSLLIRQPGVSLSELTWSSRALTSQGSAWRAPAAGFGSMAYEPSTLGLSALPYVGLGYSDFSQRTGWGFWADIGLVVQNPGPALGMGRVLSGTQGADELLRELRLSPMLQMGVNYSF